MLPEKSPIEQMAEAMTAVIETAVASAIKQAIREETITSVSPQTDRLASLAHKSVLTAKEVAILYGISASTLAKWRCDGIGPSYQKVGKKVYYTHKSVLAFIEKTEIKGRR